MKASSNFGSVVGVVIVVALLVSLVSCAGEGQQPVRQAVDDVVEAVDSLLTCEGKFALCAASTCVEIPGATVTVVQGDSLAVFPAVECHCPVLDTEQITDIDGALADKKMMGGSCDPPVFYTATGSTVGVWSLFATTDSSFTDPRPAFNLNDSLDMMECQEPNLGYGQCFSYACKYDESDSNWANCMCPLEFGTYYSEAGDCNTQRCNDQIMVGTPSPPQGATCSTDG